MVLWGTVWGGGSFTDTSEVSVTNYTWKHLRARVYNGCCVCVATNVPGVNLTP